MLVFILFSFLLLAPALQGVWDFRTQFVLEAAVFLAGGFWLFSGRLSGPPPTEFTHGWAPHSGSPQGRLPALAAEKRNIPLFFAAFFSLLAAVLSPVHALVLPEWWTFAAGLFILVWPAVWKPRALPQNLPTGGTAQRFPPGPATDRYRP